LDRDRSISSSALPYGWGDWKAFDNEGRQTTLDVLDVEVPDEHFFDFYPGGHRSRDRRGTTR